MIQEQALSEIGTATPRDPWSGWAKLVDPPDDVQGGVEDLEVELAPPVADEGPAPSEPAAPDVDNSVDVDDVGVAVARLVDELAKERRLRSDAEDRARAAQAETGRVAGELTAATARIGELERDRDEVIRRAEELLSAVRERADQRLAAELEAARRQWNDLLAAERRRVEVLEREQTVLAQRVHDAWLAAAVLRRSRPLRQRSSTPDTPEVAEEEALEDLDANETDPDFAANAPEVAEEIALLRQRLRARRHKPPEMDAVEDGVDQLRASRLARDAAAKGRRRK